MPHSFIVFLAEDEPQEKLVDELAQMKDSQEKLVAMMAQLLGAHQAATAAAAAAIVP